MPILLQLRDAYKRYGQQHLLDGAECALTDSEKVGLIGRNGAGKSTLCRILLGEEELDAGEVWRHNKLRLGYLRQHDPFRPEESVIDFLMRDSGQPDWRCGEVAWQFEFQGPALARPIGELSGGWQTRVKLAGLLLHDPNLLILDEPTNFLDMRTQMLLEDFLKTVRCGCLVVSHDRAFLRSTCSQTLELARGKLTMYPGDVDAFLENARERRLNEERTNAAILAKRRHLQEFVDRNRARASTASRARSKARQLERLQPLDIDASENTARVRVPIVEPRNGTAVRCAHVSIGYPERTIATGVDVEFGHGSRMVVVGDNGQGKTTFLRTLVGSLEPLAGEVKWGYGTEVGVYAQHVYASLPGEDTVYEFLQRRSARDVKPQTILDVAGGFLFRGDDVNKSVSVLSGGERARLCLAGLLLGKHNVLVLDEPGNHLDVETVDALAEALNNYRGTLIFTSHDRHFIGRVATGVVEVRDGRVANYPGDYGMYMYRVHKEIDDGTRDANTSRAKAAAPAAPAVTENKKKPQKAEKASETAAARKPAPPSRNDRELRKRLSNLEQKIEKLTEDKRSLNDRLMATTDPIEAQRLYDDLTIATRRLAEAEENWLEMSERLGSS